MGVQFVVKNVNMSFLNTMLCYYFSLEAASLSCLKITLPKNKSKLWASLKTHRRVQKLSLQIAKMDLNYKLQLLASEYQKQAPRGVP